MHDNDFVQVQLNRDTRIEELVEIKRKFVFREINLTISNRDIHERDDYFGKG